MHKHTVITKQQRTFMLFHFIVFTIIFALFAFIIYTRMQLSLFSLADRELTEYRDMISSRSFPPAIEDEVEHPKREPNEDRPLGNPRVTVIQWGEDGTIVNEDQIGSLSYQNYLDNLSLQTNALGSIQTIVLEDRYQFRTLTISNTEDDQGVYTQLLINVDAEVQSLVKFERILVIVSILFLLVSLFASYWLSKRTMAPVVKAWEKQVAFVENASHELRTPLTIIKNKLELLLTTPNKKIMDVFENIARTLSEANRLNKLTNDLLTLARADSTATQLEKEAFILDQFIEDVTAPYQEIAASQDKTFIFTLEDSEQITADKQRLHQLLVIVIDNALKYTTASDSITIQTELADGNHIIRIKDTGMGIQTADTEQIFERFYREDHARSREQGGTGLGLSIAEWIVTSHNGTIEALANRPTGTIIQITLP